MWYKIQIYPYDNIFTNYVCYEVNRGFYLGSRASGRYFCSEHLEYDLRLQTFLANKTYRLIETPGRHSYHIYRGQINK